MRDHGPGVDQSRREIAAHLVPRLVHLASDHAVHGDALEDDLAGEVDRHLAVGDAEQLHPPPQAHCGERLVQGRRHARHLAHHVGAFALGSITAPTVVGMPSSGSTLVAGMAMYSANAPSRSTPMMRVFLQIWLLPVRHWRQCPHTMCPSAVTSWPVRSSATPPPTAT